MKTKSLVVATLVVALTAIAFFVRRPPPPAATRQDEALKPASIGNNKESLADQEYPQQTLVPNAVNNALVDNSPNESDTVIEQLFRALGAPPLSREQLRFIQDQYDLAVKEREQIERKLAKEEPYAKGQVFITIPSYAEEGSLIYSRFTSALSENLGQAVSKQFLSTCGQSLKQLNNDFGAQEQNMLIEDTGSGYHVIHGGKRSMDKDGHPVIITGTSTGSLPYSNLSSYTHLKDLFPQAEAK